MSLFDVFLPQDGQKSASLFDDPNSAALLAAGASLLSAGGPSMTPQGIGPALGQAVNSYMSVLPQAKKVRANQQFTEAITEKFGATPVSGGGDGPYGQPNTGASLFDIESLMKDPNFMSLAMQSDQGGPFVQAALQRSLQKPQAPKYDERDFRLPDGMIQKQVSRDGGSTWEPLGEPYDARDPWKPFTSVNQETGEIEIGYHNVKTNDRTTTGAKPPPGQAAKDKEGRGAWEVVARAEDSFGRYRGLLETHGVEVIPGESKLELSGAYQDLLLEMKELYNLGVLNGPDLEIMQKVLKDPTSLGAAVYRGSTILNQLDTVVGPKLKAARERALKIYGESPIDPMSDDVFSEADRIIGG